MRFHAVIGLAVALVSTRVLAQSEPGLSPAARAEIDSVATKTLAAMSSQSASIAIVKDGAIAYVKAYGQARLAPPTPATTSMRYSIGPISKQFTATAVLMLVDEKKLSLDDRLVRFFPDLTRANEITIRQLLSHTAGIRDYWPQDYVPASMLKPITRQELFDAWAKLPLDFDPGTKSQYSNTGYAVAGAIVEKISGKPLIDFQRERIFTPLGMTSVIDVDQGTLAGTDPAGYMRYGLGPARVAPKEGKGWLFAAGHLAMTAEDLAKWDVAIIQAKLLGPASAKELSTEVVLNNGVGTRYGLGLDVRMDSNRRVLAHGGEVSGFTSENRIYPDDRAAVVVLVNDDASNTSEELAGKIAKVLFDEITPADSQKLEQARGMFLGLQKGAIDRSLLTQNANEYFSAAALADCKTGLSPFGKLAEFELKRQGLRGGMSTRVYRAKCAKGALEVVTRAMADGKYEQFQISVE